jgi:hypothetical protein
MRLVLYDQHKGISWNSTTNNISFSMHDNWHYCSVITRIHVARSYTFGYCKSQEQ